MRSLRKLFINNTRLGQYLASFKLARLWAGLEPWERRRYWAWFEEYLKGGYIKSARLGKVVEKILNEDA